MIFETDRHLSQFSTFGIGGPIRYFQKIRTQEEMEEAIVWAREKNLPLLILGKGSNTLFPDKGFDGLVLVNRIETSVWEENLVKVGGGYSLSKLAAESARKGLSGLEFGCGIPASVGGAVFMNAGAHGNELKDCLVSVGYLFFSGEKRLFLKEELEFGYRFSSFQKMAGVIVEASFSLSPFSEARKEQISLLEKRIASQPYKEKSAGCIFRNPSKEVSAGALIEKCGWKGRRVGGAVVSEMHANFIVNRGAATARDVLDLIALIQSDVYAKTGISLETEVRIL